MSEKRKIIADYLMFVGYAIVIGIILFLTIYWPVKLTNGLIDYSVYRYLDPIWIISLISILLGIILKLGKNTIKWVVSHWKYLILFFTLIFTIMLVELIRIVLNSDLNFKGKFIVLILVSAFLMFLMSKYIEEEVQKKLSKSN